MVTYSQVQELIRKLPEAKLPVAYSLLLELTDKESDALPPQLAFMRLSLAKRQKIMAQQAKQMIPHYEQIINELQQWQVGDFIDEY